MDDGDDEVRVEGVAQGGDDGEEDEKDEVEDEEDVGEDVEPVGMVGQLMEEDGEHAGAHCDDEPSF